MPCYTEKVDKLIYSEEGKSFLKSDWIELALAAIDQAGFSTVVQKEVSNLLLENSK